MVICLDKSGYQVNIFLISPLKYILWVLIRSASPRCFYWVSTTYVFVDKYEKYQYFWNEIKQLNMSYEQSNWCFALPLIYENGQVHTNSIFQVLNWLAHPHSRNHFFNVLDKIQHTFLVKCIQRWRVWNIKFYFLWKKIVSDIQV